MAKNIKRADLNVDAAIAGAKAFAEGAAQQKEVVQDDPQQEIISTPEEALTADSVAKAVEPQFVNEQHKDLGKVVTNEQTERCPFCKSTLLQTLPLHSYRNRRCSKCGVHFRIEPPLKQLNKTA